MIYECVSGDARFLVISLAESSVYHHQSAVGLYGIFSLRGMHRHVSVDDVAIVACNAESVEDAVAHLFAVTQFEVVAFFLLEYFLVGEEISFECSHF